MKLFKHWFRPSPTPTDGLTQGEREAIVDLLNYCSYVDNNISDAEELVIDRLESQVDWDHNLDFDYYVNKSVGALAAIKKALRPAGAS